MKFKRLLHSYAVKLGLAVALLMLSAAGISLLMFYNQTRPLLLAQMGSRLEDIGRTAAHLFGPTEFSNIRKVSTAISTAQKQYPIMIPPTAPGKYRKTLPDEVAATIIATKEFQGLVTLLRTIKNSSRSNDRLIDQLKVVHKDDKRPPTLAFVSLLVEAPGVPDGQLAMFLADSDYDHATVPAPPGNLLFSNSSALTSAFKGQAGADPDFRFEQGMHIITAAVPLLDEQGKQVAVLSLYYDAAGEVNYVKRLRNLCFMLLGGALGVAILVSFSLTWFLTRDIRILTLGAERVRARDFSVAIVVRRKDELGMLAASFNSMIEEVRKYSSDLEQTNAAYAKFVPRQILECLGQDSITQVRLGDQVQRQMTVMFSDIRSFTSISESMSPRDNFDFINEYLRTIGPIIRKNHGFIDKYIGDAIMALFPEKPEDAVRAGIEMHKAVEVFNERGLEIGRAPVIIGVGIHRGNLMLGTVGEEERMDGTVISDAVNLASRLEGLTKQFGAGMIVSEAVLDAIQGKSVFTTRYMGETRVKGKRRTVRIFEVIDGAENDSSRRKAVTVKDFERGLKFYDKKDFARAAKCLEEVLKINRNDVAARYYIERCRAEMGTVKRVVIPVEQERFKK